MLEKSKRILISSNFYLDEFVPEDIYSRFGKQSIIFVAKERIMRAEELRKIYGPVIINNWAWTATDPLQDSGYRVPSCPIGAVYSQHKLNCADDLHFVKFNGQGKPAYDQIREDIKKDPAKFLAIGITTIEEGTWSWLHADRRNTTGLVAPDAIYIVPYR